MWGGEPFRKEEWHAHRGSTGPAHLWAGVTGGSAPLWFKNLQVRSRRKDWNARRVPEDTHRALGTCWATVELRYCSSLGVNWEPLNGFKQQSEKVRFSILKERLLGQSLGAGGLFRKLFNSPGGGADV